MNIFDIITFDEEKDIKAIIQKNIKLYNIGQVILITTINIIMFVLGNKLINGLINIGTYYIVVYILYKISKNVITNSESQTY